MADRKTYGGFFALERCHGARGENSRICHLGGAISFYNARSAIAALIRENAFRDVVLPHYICPVVHRAVEETGAPARFYPVTPDFSPDYSTLAAMVREDTLLIVPAYFGVCLPDMEALSLLSRGTGCRVLLDYAQALYEPCPAEFSAVYSPRKFLGVPDGGFLLVGAGSRLKAPAQPVHKVDQSVFGERLACHGTRGEYPSGDLLDAFRALEQNMPSGAIRMSGLAMSIFTAFDHDAACAQRTANHDALASALGSEPAGGGSVPLCYPFRVDPSRFEPMRKALIKAGVFVPFYWPGPPDLMRPGTGVLPLPVDHRYNFKDMAAVAGAVIEILHGRSS